MCLGFVGSTAMLSSLWGRLVLSQFIRMFPPPRSVPSVHEDIVIVPIPDTVGSLSKSAADENIPDIAGPLNCVCLALATGTMPKAEEAVRAIRKRAVAIMAYLRLLKKESGAIFVAIIFRVLPNRYRLKLLRMSLL